MINIQKEIKVVHQIYRIRGKYTSVDEEELNKIKYILLTFFKKATN